jgi:membrane protein
MKKNPSIMLPTITHSIKRLFMGGYTYRASALAFTTLLAVVPLASVVVALAAHFPFFADLVTIAQRFVLNNFIPSTNVTIQTYLYNFTQQASHMTTSGIFFLFFSATLMIITVEDTIDEIWQATQRKKQFFAWVVYWVVLLVAPLAVGLSVFLSTLFFSLSWFSSGIVVELLKMPLLEALSLLMNTILFSVLYVIVPNAKVRWRDGLLGGFLAAVLFEIAKSTFTFYIHTFTSYELIYGALATIPIFLVWVYISWVIVLYGALFTRTRGVLREEARKGL